MKRMITKKMRDSFNVSFSSRLNLWCNRDISGYLKQTEKQRILILRRTVK